jgi:GDP-L-fucose synthase
MGDVLAPSRADLDLSDVPAVRDYWAAHRPTRLVHLAAFARGLGGHLTAREQSFLDNEAVIRGPLVVALEQGVESVFFAGTVAEYGWPYQSLPLREDDVYTGPPHAGESFYAQAKRLAPQYLDAIRDRHGSSITHGLLTNLYGPGANYDPLGSHVLPALIRRFHEA